MTKLPTLVSLTIAGAVLAGCFSYTKREEPAPPPTVVYQQPAQPVPPPPPQ